MKQKRITPKNESSKSADSESLSDYPGETVLVDGTGLKNLQSRATLVAYSREIWQRRSFILAQARAKSLNTGRGMFLGKFWIFLNPLIQIATYGLIFGVVLKVSKGVDNYIGFLILGVVFFGMITKGLSVGSGLVRGAKGLIAALSFPTASIVFSTTIRMFIDNIVPASVAVAGALLFQISKPPSFTVLLVLPLFIMMHFFIAGVLFICGRMAAFVPDLKSLINVIQRGLFFVSGVFFSIDRYATHPALSTVMNANPIYQFLKAIRSCVLEGIVPEMSVWVYLMAWSFGLFGIGYVFFWQAEERYSDVK